MLLIIKVDIYSHFCKSFLIQLPGRSSVEKQVQVQPSAEEGRVQLGRALSAAPQTYAPAFGSNPSLYLSWRQMRGKHLRLNIDFCFKLLHGQIHDILLLLVVLLLLIWERKEDPIYLKRKISSAGRINVGERTGFNDKRTLRESLAVI